MKSIWAMEQLVAIIGALTSCLRFVFAIRVPIACGMPFDMKCVPTQSVSIVFHLMNKYSAHFRAVDKGVSFEVTEGTMCFEYIPTITIPYSKCMQ